MKTIDRQKVEKLSAQEGRTRGHLRISNRRKDLQRLISSILIVGCLVVAIWASVVFFQANNNGYVISVEGQEIATLTCESEAKAAIDKYLQAQAGEFGYEVTYNQDLKIEPRPADQCNFISSDEAALLLDDCLTPVVEASILLVDGTPVMALPNEKEALNVLEKAKGYYINDGEIIYDAKICEEVAVVTENRSPDSIVMGDIARNILLFGSPQDVTHTVVSSAETMWSIANQYQMSVNDLQKANPGLTSDDLKIGMTVRLSAIQPKLTVVVVKEVTKTQAVAYQTKTIDNSDMLRGTQKIITPGKAGEEEATLKVVETNGKQTSASKISSVVTVEPVTQVVERGTKIIVASRGSGGSGIVSWPLRGKITSYFGPRGRGYHFGLDIDGTTGQHIAAAESGKVVCACWGGGYGYYIKIDHGDGLSTLYAHLSKIVVSVGSTVSKGQYIGNVGSTGNSSGSHLHFEVIVNGKQYNPLNYLP
ncbi:MAG: M23 family metallopeptidase [Clostridia bacterium]|nr:M23 family metallopeptidase [Clostridia bacterium]MDD4798700.1 M23 family metallopeptidase [Clostridia bacterium]